MFYQDKRETEMRICGQRRRSEIRSGETIKKTILCGVAGALMLFGGATTASAVPTISIDLDPGTAGIQNTLTVAQGASFTFDVVFIGDGTTLFDAFAMDVGFNDQGAILGLTGGTGSPTAGSIADNCIGTCVDLFGGVPIFAGSTLTTGPFAPPAPFTAQLGTVGIVDDLFQFTISASNGPIPNGDPVGVFGGPIGAGVEINLFSVTLDALTSGTSVVRLLPLDFITGENIADPSGTEPASTTVGAQVLFLQEGPVPANLNQGTVTVQSVPEPATLSLMGAGLLGLGAATLRRRRRKAQ